MEHHIYLLNCIIMLPVTRIVIYGFISFLISTMIGLIVGDAIYGSGEPSSITGFIAVVVTVALVGVTLSIPIARYMNAHPGTWTNPPLVPLSVAVGFIGYELVGLWFGTIGVLIVIASEHLIRWRSGRHS